MPLLNKPEAADCCWGRWTDRRLWSHVRAASPGPLGNQAKGALAVFEAQEFPCHAVRHVVVRSGVINLLRAAKRFRVSLDESF